MHGALKESVYEQQIIKDSLHDCLVLITIDNKNIENHREKR